MAWVFIAHPVRLLDLAGWWEVRRNRVKKLDPSLRWDDGREYCDSFCFSAIDALHGAEALMSPYTLAVIPAKAGIQFACSTLVKIQASLS